jgi:ferritin-like metal-binding protein YciE
MKPNSLQHLYVEQLLDLYDAEHQIIKALPKMVDAAQSEKLKNALNEHLDITRQQATRIERIFKSLGEKLNPEKCRGMQGIIQEGDQLIRRIKDPDVKDAAIIASAQRVEHYEMAGYGTAATYADLLNDSEARGLLEQTLGEEKEADQSLTNLAREINVQAAEQKQEEETSRVGGRTRRAA